MALTQHWKLDDDAATTNVVATVGTDATLIGGDNTSVKHSTDAPAGGSISASFDFNGTDDAVDFNASTVSWNSGSAHSLSLFFLADSTTAKWIFGDLDASKWYVKIESNTVIKVRGSATERDFTVPAIGTTNWHHLLVTKTAGNSVRVFLDGVESSTGALSISESSSVDLIGGASTVRFDGHIAWVKLFDSDESANVATLYAEGFGGAAATSYTFTGPTSGVVNVASTNFTVTPDGDADGITVTPATDGTGTFTPTSVTFTGSGAETFTYTPTSSAGSPHTLSVTDDGGLTDPASIDYTVTSGTVAITTPVTKQLFHRSRSTGLADIPITGTYTGTPTAIEASFNGGAYATIDAAPAGGTYSGTLAGQAKGDGTLTVRFTSDTGVTATVATIRVGVLFFVFGQSNADGRTTDPQPYDAVFSGSRFKASTWADIADPLGGQATGSPWMRLAAMIAAAENCPVGVCVVASGGTSVTDWQPLDALYEAAVDALADIGGLVEFAFWLQGESDAIAGMSEATYTTNFGNIVTGFETDAPGVKIMPSTLLNSTSAGTGAQRDAINAALQSFWTDARCLRGPDLTDVPTTDGLHATTDGQANCVAAKAFQAWDDAFESAGVGVSGSRIFTGF